MAKKNKEKHAPIAVKKIGGFVYLSILIIVPLLLNWKSLSFEFTTLDDTEIIVNKFSYLSDYNNIFKIFQLDNFMSATGNNYYRPMQTISFMADSQLGGDKPLVYHFANIVYHILTVISLFFLFKGLKLREDISFFLSLLFSVHPLFTDAVAWVVGRGDLLAGLFGTLTFITFLKYSSTKNKIWIVFHGAAFFIALFSKEIAMLLPVLIYFYYWYVQEPKLSTREIFPLVLIWAVLVVAFCVMRSASIHAPGYISLNYFVSNVFVIPVVFSKLFVPICLSPMPFYNVLFTIAGVLSIIAAGYIFLKSKPENKPLLLFGVIWFVLFLIPGMFVKLPFAGIKFEYLECRAYLPAVGIFISSGVFINALFTEKRKQLIWKIFIAVLIVFSALEFNYAGVFENPVSFFSAAIQANSNSAMAFSSRGNVYFHDNKPELALSDFDEAIRICPTYSEPYFYKGVLYSEQNDHINAEHYYSLALKYDTLYCADNDPSEFSYIHLSVEKVILKKYDEAIALLKIVTQKYPENGIYHNDLGLTYFYSGKYDSALSEYNKALKAIRNHVYFVNRGIVKYHLLDIDGAIMDFNTALTLKPDYIDAFLNRGMARIRSGEYEKAIADFTTVINYNPATGAAYYYRGDAYAKMNNAGEANKDKAEAQKLGYQDGIHG